MRFIGTILFVIVFVFIGYEFFRIAPMWGQYVVLMNSAQAYQSDSGDISILVLGDDFAEGVGASGPDQSLPGVLAQDLDASVEDHAQPGAGIADLEGQLQQAQQKHYDLILVEAGSSDIVEMHSIDQDAEDMQNFLQSATSYSDHVAILSTGLVGDAPIFPSLIGDLMNDRVFGLRTELETAVAEAGGGDAYVDLTGVGSPSSTDASGSDWAADGYHPSDVEYALWAQTTEAAIAQAWPGSFTVR